MTVQAAIKVKPDTKKRLEVLADYKDSMDSVIVKLLDCFEKRGVKK